MPMLVWDAPGERRYETGVDRGVLFLSGSNGIPWNGLVEVSDTPGGGEITSYWLDEVKYLDTVGGEDYEASISAFTYPDEFEPYQGLSQIQEGLFATGQPRPGTFNLSYRTRIANDVSAENFAYRIHIIMNCTVAPLARDHKTLSDTNDADAFKWNLVAVPIYVPGLKPTSHLIIDSRYMDPVTLESIESVLYGSDGTTSHLPTLTNLLDLIVMDGSIKITDNGDGTWTAIGPNEFITMLNDIEFQITNANAVYSIDGNSYTVQDTES